MKRRTAVLCSLVAASICAAAPRARDVIGEFVLQPHEKKELSVKAADAVDVLFETMMSAADEERARHSCVELWAGHSAASSCGGGGASRVKPENGQIRVTVENLEDFVIKVQVYVQQP